MDLQSITGFDWDKGNDTKNKKHGVAPIEIERVFANTPLLIAPDKLHSVTEERSLALGVTDEGRRLSVVFTLREDSTRIRPMGARPMNRKERKTYEEQGA